jgi:hypothetical protein
VVYEVVNERERERGRLNEGEELKRRRDEEVEEYRGVGSKDILRCLILFEAQVYVCRGQIINVEPK